MIEIAQIVLPRPPEELLGRVPQADDTTGIEVRRDGDEGFRVTPGLFVSGDSNCALGRNHLADLSHPAFPEQRSTRNARSVPLSSIVLFPTWNRGGQRCWNLAAWMLGRW